MTEREDDEGEYHVPTAWKKFDLFTYNHIKEYLVNKQLDSHIDNVCYILKQALMDLSSFTPSKNSTFKKEMLSLYNNLDKQHLKFKMVGDKKEDDIIIEDKRILKFIKLVILEGILENDDGGAIVFEKLEGRSLLINNIYYECMLNLCIYFTKSELKLEERLAYEMIYEILELSNLLPLRTSKNEKLDEDKYRYVHRTLGRFLENNPYYDTKDYDIETFIFTYSYTFSDYSNSNGEEYFEKWQKVENEVVPRITEIRTILTS